MITAIKKFGLIISILQIKEAASFGKFHQIPSLHYSLSNPKIFDIQRQLVLTDVMSLTQDPSTLDESSFWFPLYLSGIAGASTCIGAAIVFLLPKKRVSSEVMSFSLALAGSVMVTISLISLGPECLQHIDSTWIALQRLASAGTGALIYFVLSLYALPDPDEILGMQEPSSKAMSLSTIGEEKNIDESSEKEHHGKDEKELLSIKSLEDGNDYDITASPKKERKAFRRKQSIEENEAIPFLSPDVSKKAYWEGEDLETRDQRKAWRVALLLFFSLLIHNFPEGLAVAASTLQSSSLGLTVMVGIMIHNIPEGICIAVPCHAARPNQKWISFALASASGLAEPLGALVALIFLKNLGSNDASSLFSLENVLAFVAAIMTSVAMFELFPEARRHNTGLPFWGGNFAGFAIMSITELVLDH